MTIAAAAAPADCIGPYRRLRQLGSGGMGEVYLAHDSDLGRNIAVKILPPHLNNAEYLSRLRHEARTASSLNHPNIITIYEIGRDGDHAYMAMEFVEGLTLRELIAAGALPVKKALQIASQIADGLAAAHRKDLVHRDLKPENVMITNDGVVKILDFGLAKSVGPSNDTARSIASDPGTIVGTFCYMSPEQARGVAMDYRSDQFALGSMLYEMLTGKRAFDGATAVETLLMVVRDEPAPLSAVAAHVPAPVRWIVDRCLSKDPDERYVATRDLARDLQYLRDHFSEAGLVTPIREGEAQNVKRRRAMAIAAAALVAGLSLGTAVTAWVRKPAPRTITTERYLTYSGNDYAPAVSPDGKLIAFSSNRDGTQRIWLRQVGSGSEVALTSGADDFPRFSPDGSAVLYQHVEPGKPAGLYRVPVVGGEPRRLVDQAGTGEWSPDGSKLAFVRAGVGDKGQPFSSIFLANADGSNPRELARSETLGVAHPRWSPDGKWIATVEATGRVAQGVILIDTSNGKTRRLTSPPKAGETSAVVWAADSKAVMYVRAESVEAVVGSSAKIIRHDIHSDEAEVIGWSSHNATMLDILGDGKIVFDARSPRDNLREISTASQDDAPKWITRGNSSDRQPAYSPDGKSILFTSNRSGNLDLWIIATDGGTVKRITDDDAEDWDPAFSADGTKIVWSSGRSGNLEIWMANADGTEARQVSKDGFDAENPGITPDGQWIVYNSFNPKKPGIWKVRSDGTEASVLVPGRTAIPEISPDGRYVAYLAGGRTPNPNIRVVSLADGKDMGFSIPTAARRRTSAILGRTRWMPDGKALAYLGQNEDGVNGVFVQEFVPGKDTTATRRPLGGFDHGRSTESFGISRDGSKIAVAGWEQLFSLVSVDGIPEIKTRKRNDKS